MARTQWETGQYGDGTITAAKIVAGAGIETSKLADGANFMKKDGSVVMTGALDAGNNKLTNVTTGTNSGDAVNKGQLDTAIAAVTQLWKYKDAVIAAATANVTISNPGTLTFDGITLTTGQRLLLKNQTAPAENGIYVVATSSTAMTRATDMDAWTEIPGAIIPVEQGTVNADTLWLSTGNSGGTIGTTAITLIQIPTTTSGLTNSNFVDEETPSGTINSSNTAFTLANTPTAGTLKLYYQGQKLRPGAGNDYTITGNAITMLWAPVTGTALVADYRK